jgi:hypothetical protein
MVNTKHKQHEWKPNIHSVTEKKRHKQRWPVSSAWFSCIVEGCITENCFGSWEGKRGGERLFKTVWVSFLPMLCVKEIPCLPTNVLPLRYQASARHVDEICTLLEIVTRRRVKIPYGRFGSRRISWHLKMGLIGCPETSVRNCHSSLRNIPEEHRLLLSLLKKPPFVPVKFIFFSVYLTPTYLMFMFILCILNNKLFIIYQHMHI